MTALEPIDDEQEVECTITLTDSEVYTLQILLGHVAGDSECHSIYTKLEEAGAYDNIDTEDFDRIRFYQENDFDNTCVELPKDLYNSVVIRITE